MYAGKTKESADSIDLMQLQSFFLSSFLFRKKLMPNKKKFRFSSGISCKKTATFEG
jgi:hypothetical protein